MSVKTASKVNVKKKKEQRNLIAIIHKEVVIGLNVIKIKVTFLLLKIL